MTKISRENLEVKCPNCGQIHNLDLYDSVNVKVNPELKEKVYSGEINVFPCAKGQLLQGFLYTDEDRWIWVNPEFLLSKKEEIELEIKEDQEHNQIFQMAKKFLPKQYFVFGYQELSELLLNLDSK